jgi:hypothetical protein
MIFVIPTTYMHTRSNQDGEKGLETDRVVLIHPSVCVQLPAWICTNYRFRGSGGDSGTSGPVGVVYRSWFQKSGVILACDGI